MLTDEELDLLERLSKKVHGKLVITLTYTWSRAICAFSSRAVGRLRSTILINERNHHVRLDPTKEQFPSGRREQSRWRGGR